MTQAAGPEVRYDALDRQTSAARTGHPAESYRYDHAGRRIEKGVGGISTQYHYDGLAIHQTVRGDWQAPISRTVHGLAIDSPLLQYTSGQPLAFHQDALGSVVATTNAATGALVATQGFDAFGNGQAALTTATPIPSYGYTGREPDATGLTYFRARYYAPQWGRFTQADPAGFIDGVNRYTYAMNSPLNYTDPLGLAAVGSVGGTGGSWLSRLQIGLDVVGATAEYVFPGPGTAIGIGADLLSAGLSASGGNMLAASAALAAAIPYAGSLATIFKATDRVGEGVDAAKGVARGGESAAAAAGRQAHKELAERVAQKPGWQSEPRLVGADGKVYKPDVVTPGGHILELKPNTPSGRAAGARQIQNYEDQLGMRGRVIYYEPKP